jgi:hypothetical protein
MPTAAKLFAAFSFAIVAFFTAEVVKPHMPEGTQFGLFSVVSAVIGAFCGWKVMGPAAGNGYIESANGGLKTSLIMTLFALFIFSTEEMLVLAFRRTYKSPMEAVVGIVQLAIEFVQTIFVLDVLTVLLLGGALAGCFVEWAARRWR